MKKYIIIIFSLFLSSIIWSQVLSIPNGSVFNVSNNTNLILSGNYNLLVNSTSANFNGNVKFISDEEQTISGSIPVEISNLYVDNNGLVLENDLTISSELDMQNGIINIQDNNLTITNSANITGNFANDCMIVKNENGVFQRNVSENGTYLFPIGDISGAIEYSPAEIDMLNGTYTNANIEMNVFNSKFSQNTSITSYLNRYWAVSANGITNPEYDINLTFVPNDVVGDENQIYGAYYTTEWNLLNPVISNSIVANNISEFGTFTGGEQSAFVVGINKLTTNDIQIIGLEDGIRINSNLELIKIDIFNILGQKIFEQKDVNSNTLNFNSNVQTAVYFVRIQTNKGVLSKKVLIY